MSGVDGGHILIVDDTLKNIQLLGRLLRNDEFRVSVARNGQQALDSTARLHPDLVLLDVRMPEMDGFEVCRRLKANPETADVPVIFVTASFATEDIVKGFDLGAVDYVTKPFKSSELLSRVRTHLSLKQLRHELHEEVEKLNRALAQIERMHREQAAFLRHELSNAIAPILGYSDMLLREVSLSVPEHRRWLSHIATSATGVRTLLDALTKLQSLERGDEILEKELIDLGSLIKDEVRDITATFEEAMDVALDVQSGQCTIRADPRLIPGVYRNLIKNAMEHVRHLPPAERRLAVQVFSKGRAIVTQVSNGGPPIPKARLDTFFEKFNSTKTRRGGVGLGTSYAFLVTTAHGGQISVTSSAKEGTTVTVTMRAAT